MSDYNFLMESKLSQEQYSVLSLISRSAYEPNHEPRGPPEESERTFVPDEDDPLPPKERKRSAAGGELTFVDEATFWATF